MKQFHSPEEIVHVSSSMLRDAFNDSQLPRLIEQGELTSEVLRDAHLEIPQRVGETTCTRGQMIRYLDSQGTWIVEVFQYVRPDASLGASGLPDPKRMRVGLQVWIATITERA